MTKGAATVDSCSLRESSGDDRSSSQQSPYHGRAQPVAGQTDSPDQISYTLIRAIVTMERSIHHDH